MQSRIAPAAVFVTILLGVPAAQQQPAQTARLAFDVASVKRSPPVDSRAVGPRAGLIEPGGVWRSTDATLMMLIRSLYPGHDFPGQIAELPSWASTDMFDIQAKTDANRSPDEMRMMARTLLADRFRLTMHTERREMPAYDLVLARADRRLGSGLSRPAIDCDDYRDAVAKGERAPSGPSGFGDRLHCVATVMPVMDHTRRVPGATARLTAGGMRLSEVVNLMANQVGRPVVDRTGLTERFDIELQFSRAALMVNADGDAAAGPAFFTALQEQLGLKMEPSRAFVDVLVIDHVEPPAPN